MTAAKNLPANAVQAQVDEAKDRLNEAIAGLRYTLGDVNGDGKVRAEDALLALQAATKKITLTEIQQYAADVDGKDGVTAADALMILQAATSKITLV